MLCNNCGKENLNEAVFCLNCGHHLSEEQSGTKPQDQPQTPPPLTAVNISKDAQSMQNNLPSSSESENADTLLAAFVGEKYDSYYRDKWFKDSVPSLEVNKKGFSIYSFNLAGFFLGVFWLCYRKMYVFAASIILAMTIVDIAMMYLLGMESYNDSGNLTYGVVWVVLTGFLGNYFYLYDSARKIKKITGNGGKVSGIEQQLAAKGGTSWVGAIGVGLLLVAISVLIAYLFAPSWYLI